MTENPIWMRGPHFSWCVVPHRDGDHPENRVCTNARLGGKGPGEVGVPLSLYSAQDNCDRYVLPTALACLEYGFREVEPRVVISFETSDVVEMTLDEAEQFAERLAEQIRLGRATQRGEGQ